MIPPDIKHFNLFDIGFVIFTCMLIIFGYLRGIVKEILSLSSWLSAGLVCLWSADYLDSLLGQYVTQFYIRKFLAYLIPFIFSITFFLILTSIISDKVDKTKFSLANKPLGAIFGIIKSGVIFIIIYLLVLILDQHAKIKIIHEAKISGIFKPIAEDTLLYIKLNQNKIKNTIEETLGNFPKLKAKRNPIEEANQLAVPQISESIIKNEKANNKQSKVMKNLREKQKKFHELIHGNSSTISDRNAKMNSDIHRKLIKNLIEELEDISD